VSSVDAGYFPLDDEYIFKLQRTPLDPGFGIQRQREGYFREADDPLFKVKEKYPDK
jgi:hypothetical protein